jgi:mannose-6-phosphate isomerase
MLRVSEEDFRNRFPLYPLTFEPIYQYRLWGGRRLAGLLTAPLPDGPVGEAWLLSDREDQQSRVANGPLQGRTIGELLKARPEELLGSLPGRFDRFPLLLKFLDARDQLSVQVHPSDRQAAQLRPGELGKTEAWVVLEAAPDSWVYAGLKPGTTVDGLREALTDGAVAECLAGFTPKAGDGVFLPKTGQPRELQVEEALACADFSAGPVVAVGPVVAELDPVSREQLFDCAQFGLSRLRAETPFTVGAPATPRVLVCICGEGAVEHDGQAFPVRMGDVVLLPAVVGACVFRPRAATTLLEVSLPDGTTK